jgi:hypothetical protein
MNATIRKTVVLLCAGGLLGAVGCSEDAFTVTHQGSSFVDGHGKLSHEDYGDGTQEGLFSVEIAGDVPWQAELDKPGALYALCRGVDQIDTPHEGQLLIDGAEVYSKDGTLYIGERSYGPVARPVSITFSREGVYVNGDFRGELPTG